MTPYQAIFVERKDRQTKGPSNRQSIHFYSNPCSNPACCQVVNTTFAEYTTQRLNEIEACLQRASAYKRRYSRNLSGDSAETHRLNDMSPSSHAKSGGDPVVGWAAGLDLARWMEVQCYTRDSELTLSTITCSCRT